jgi:hypothetical protein
VFEWLSWKLEAGSSKLEAESSKLEAGSSKQKNRKTAMAAFKAQDQGARIPQSEAYFLYAAAKAG